MAKPEAIAAIIARQLEKTGIAKRVKQASVEHVWPAVAGAEIAAHTRFVKADMGRIFIAVDSPVWRQELFFKKEELIEILNRELGDDIVTDIMFTGP
jgi:predicted nucleic acid-binding Zn ribbon protein